MTQLRIATPESDIHAEERARARAERDRFVNRVMLHSWRKQFWWNLSTSVVAAAMIYWLERKRQITGAFDVALAVGVLSFYARAVMDTGKRVDAIAKVLQKNGIFMDYVQRG